VTTRARPDKLAIGFTVVWMTFWASAILVGVWYAGAAALSGEPTAALFLAVWLGFAGFALVSVGRRLLQRLRGETTPGRQHKNHRWNDGVARRDPKPKA
jgi:hypothetical protein